MARINQSLKFGVYGVIIILFVQCNADKLDFDNIEIPNLTATQSLPLGSTTYTIKELIEDLSDSSLVVEEDNGLFLTVVYRDTSSYNETKDLIDLGNISNPIIVSPNISIPSSPTNQDFPIPTVPSSFDYTTPSSGEELDSVTHTSGTIILDISSQFDVDLDYILTLDDVINVENGQAMVFKGILGANESASLSKSLANHKTIIEANTFGGKFDGVLKIKTGNTILSSDEIIYTLSINDAEFDGIYGYFGEKSIDVQSDTLNMSFFEGISENGIVFNSPSINFLISNAYGVPMGLNLSGISSSNADGTKIDLTGTITESLQQVRAPSITDVGKSRSSLISINSDNSNIRDLLSTSPNQFVLAIDAKSNFKNPDKERNFMIESSKMDIITEISLPLDVRLQGFQRDFGSNVESFDFEEADTITLVLTTTNRLPFAGVIDMQFMTADSSVLFEYKDVLLMDSPEIVDFGRTGDAITNMARFPIYRGNGYQELLDASILNLKMNINSYQAADGNFVKIYSNYELLLEVQMEGTLNYELD